MGKGRKDSSGGWSPIFLCYLKGPGGRKKITGVGVKCDSVQKTTTDGHHIRQQANRQAGIGTCVWRIHGNAEEMEEEEEEEKYRKRGKNIRHPSSFSCEIYVAATVVLSTSPTAPSVDQPMR